MKPENIPFGKRLKSGQSETMFYNYPGSNDTETLPAGKPSPIIESYVLEKGGFYALSKKGSPKNIYLKDTDRLQVVPEDAKDESGFFSGLFYDATDFFTNTGKDVASPFKYLKVGFNETIKDAKKIFPFDNLKELILWVAVPVAVILFLMLANNLSD
jgi:predicted RNA binding protein YcfA (HicA-like mRNA interferase family)